MSAPRTTKIVVSTGAPELRRKVVDRDEGRSAAADCVEERDQLRHRGHLHGPGRVQACAATDGEPDHDDAERDPAQATLTGQQVDKSGPDRNDHAGGAELIAAAAGGGRVHPVQAQHEAGRPRQPGEVDDGVDPLF
jgi:hypothetical protein